jgi:hypothetical protein
VKIRILRRAQGALPKQQIPLIYNFFDIGRQALICERFFLWVIRPICDEYHYGAFAVVRITHLIVKFTPITHIKIG